MRLDAEAAGRIEQRMLARGEEIPRLDIGGVSCLSIGNLVRLPQPGSKWVHRRFARAPVSVDIGRGIMHYMCKCDKHDPAYVRMPVMRGISLGYRYCPNNRTKDPSRL